MNATDEYFDKMRKKIEASLIAALPPVSNDKGSSEKDTGKDIALPCREAIFSGGKRWRPMILMMFAVLRKGVFDLQDREVGLEFLPFLNVDDAFNLCPLVEFPHNASLIHDDIEDGAVSRRGRPCVHITYGVDVALNAASWLYFKATDCIENAPLDDSAKYTLYTAYTAAIRTLHEGQALDIAWHKAEGFFPTVQQYTSMTAMKTGSLSSLAAMIGSIISNVDKRDLMLFHKAAMTLGTAFQALDDARDIMGGIPGKDKGDDIVEGKKSLPVLLHLQNRPEDKDKITSLFQKAKAEGIKSDAVQECITLLTDSGAAEAAYERGRRLGKNAIEGLPTEEMRIFARNLLGIEETALPTEDSHA